MSTAKTKLNRLTLIRRSRGELPAAAQRLRAPTPISHSDGSEPLSYETQLSFTDASLAPCSRGWPRLNIAMAGRKAVILDCKLCACSRVDVMKPATSASTAMIL
jgi:hypothetical protein